jgi:hypothetical protein
LSKLKTNWKNFDESDGDGKRTTYNAVILCYQVLNHLCASGDKDYQAGPQEFED